MILWSRCGRHEIICSDDFVLNVPLCTPILFYWKKKQEKSSLASWQNQRGGPNGRRICLDSRAEGMRSMFAKNCATSSSFWDARSKGRASFRWSETANSMNPDTLPGFMRETNWNQISWRLLWSLGSSAVSASRSGPRFWRFLFGTCPSRSCYSSSSLLGWELSSSCASG